MTRPHLRWTLWLVDLLFPPRCVACGQPPARARSDIELSPADGRVSALTAPSPRPVAAAGSRTADPSAALSPPGDHLLCASCRASLTTLRSPLCARCGAPTAWPVTRCTECSGRRLAFSSARAAVAYDGAARSLVHAWKERGLHPLAAAAAELVTTVVPRPAADVITYIPPDGDRSLRRGRQPSAELARQLAKQWQLETAPLLERTRPVEQQTGLTRVERRRNVRNAFVAATRSGPMPRLVALVDDVYTTGATVASAASALRAGGVREVHVVTFARTVR